MKTIKKLLSSSIALVLLFTVLTMSETTQAQQVNKVFDEIGGGGSNSSGNSESGSSNTMYIIGGAIIVGVILYAVLKEKKEPVKTDTTAVAIMENQFVLNQTQIEEQINKSNNLPINIFAGVQNEILFREEKKYVVGLSFNF